VRYRPARWLFPVLQNDKIVSRWTATCAIADHIALRTAVRNDMIAGQRIILSPYRTIQTLDGYVADHAKVSHAPADLHMTAGRSAALDD